MRVEARDRTVTIEIVLQCLILFRASFKAFRVCFDCGKVVLLLVCRISTVLELQDINIKLYQFRSKLERNYRIGRVELEDVRRMVDANDVVTACRSLVLWLFDGEHDILWKYLEDSYISATVCLSHLPKRPIIGALSEYEHRLGLAVSGRGVVGYHGLLASRISET